MLNRAMKSFLNDMLSNEEVIQNLLKIVKEIETARTEANCSGLTDDDSPFKIRLRNRQHKVFYENDQLVSQVHDFTNMLRKSRTVYWQKKESARVGMYYMRKRLFRKNKHPPEGMQDAIQVSRAAS